MTITVFTTNNCMRCKMVKRWLDEHNLQYKAINVSENKAEKLHLNVLGFTSAPVTRVSKPDEHDEFIVGFDVKKLNELLGGK